MLNKYFQRNNEARYNPLHNDLDPESVALNVKSQAKKSRILRHSREKSFGQSLKERPYTLTQLFLFRSAHARDPRTQEITKVIANLKRYKSLRCLNIDLNWLLSIWKGHVQFFDSLKHLKNLSIIHFYVTEETVSYKSLSRLNQSLDKLPIAPRVEIRLSFFSYFGATQCSFSELLRSLSRFGNLTSVQLTFVSGNLRGIRRALDVLQDYKHVSRLDITIRNMMEFSSCEGLPNKLFDSLKRVKSIKYSKITFSDLIGLQFKDLEALVPILQEAIQLFNLEVRFQMDGSSQLLASDWDKFMRLVKDSNAPYRFWANYNGKFVTSTLKDALICLAIYFLIFLMIDVLISYVFN